MQHQGNVQTFRDLLTWQEAHKLALVVYKITESFPTTERFGLISQVRRCAVSVTSNIAEGFGRRTMNDKKHFYDMAIGSLFELQNQLLLSKDLKFIKEQQFNNLWDQSLTVNRLLNGLIRSTLLPTKPTPIS
jgi:four helix bundle protein